MSDFLFLYPSPDGAILIEIGLPSPGQGVDVPFWYSTHTPLTFQIDNVEWERGGSSEASFLGGAGRASLNEGSRLMEGNRIEDSSRREGKRGCLPKTPVLGS